MVSRARLCSALFLAVGLAGVAPAETLVFRGARVLPISAPAIDDGAVVVRDGEIERVGSSAKIRTPRNGREIDVSGLVLMPGLVDTHSHLGGVTGGDSSAPLHPAVRALDGIDIHDESLWRARAGGLTTINVMPGSGHLMSGQTVYLKLRENPRTVEDWLFCTDPLEDVCGSMKMANGTNSMRDKPFPGTRAKSAALVRELFVRASEHDAEDNRDLGLEAVREVLSGKRRVQFHTHRHDDIATVLRLKREFGFTPVIQHGTESWMLAEELAREGIGVSFTLVDSPGGKEEILRMRMDAPALLERAGVAISVNTDDWITDSRLFLRTAAIAVRFGMTREGALRAVTLTPAEQLGLEDRIGSLEAGKDADLVLLSGDPFSVYTRVEETWVEGRRVYDADDPAHRVYATGGYRVYPASAAEHDHAGCGG